MGKRQRYWHGLISSCRWLHDTRVTSMSRFVVHRPHALHNSWIQPRPSNLTSGGMPQALPRRGGLDQANEHVGERRRITWRE
jgi:hypothetical protein